MNGDADRHPTTHAGTPWPVEIRLMKEERRLEVVFDDQRTMSLSAEYLRVLSPSAEVQGHAPDQKITIWGKRDVGIAALEPVGRYAVKIVFDDGHDSGLFTWSYLYELGADHDRLWGEYLAELAGKGLAREPRIL